LDKNLKPDDPDELGTKYVLFAQEAKTKLVTNYHVSGRAIEDAVELLTDRKTGEIGAQSSRFLPATTGMHTKAHWSSLRR